jgi:hypothetical protein
MQARASIVKYNFKKRPPAPETVRPARHDLPARQRRFVQAQIENPLEMPPVLIPPRPMQKKVLHRCKTEALQLRLSLRSDPVKIPQWENSRILSVRHINFIEMQL